MDLKQNIRFTNFINSLKNYFERQEKTVLVINKDFIIDYENLAIHCLTSKGISFLQFIKEHLNKPIRPKIERLE